MDEKKKMKMAIIAGASHAMNYKQKNPGATEEQVLQHITKEANFILENIDGDD